MSDGSFSHMMFDLPGSVSEHTVIYPDGTYGVRSEAAMKQQIKDKLADSDKPREGIIQIQLIEAGMATVQRQKYFALCQHIAQQIEEPTYDKDWVHEKNCLDLLNTMVTVPALKIHEEQQVRFSSLSYKAAEQLLLKLEASGATKGSRWYGLSTTLPYKGPIF